MSWVGGQAGQMWLWTTERQQEVRQPRTNRPNDAEPSSGKQCPDIYVLSSHLQSVKKLQVSVFLKKKMHLFVTSKKSNLFILFKLLFSLKTQICFHFTKSRGKSEDEPSAGQTQLSARALVIHEGHSTSYQRRSRPAIRGYLISQSP